MFNFRKLTAAAFLASASFVPAMSSAQDLKGEGYAALADNKVDMMVRPAAVGLCKIQQFGQSGEFRVLSIPKAVVGSKEMQARFGRLACPDFTRGDIFQLRQINRDRG